MSKEAMKLALEALEYIEHNYMSLPAPAEKAITALREALAEQPAQQEPFGYFKAEPFGWTDCAESDEGAVALYERPQPAQQEPVAYRVKWPAIGGGYKWLMVDKPLMEKEGFANEALYTSPPAQRTWVGLTDADKQEAFDETQEASGGFWEFADYLEAKLKEKNT